MTPVLSLGMRPCSRGSRSRAYAAAATARTTAAPANVHLRIRARHAAAGNACASWLSMRLDMTVSLLELDRLRELRTDPRGKPRRLPDRRDALRPGESPRRPSEVPVAPLRQLELLRDE